jgi:hypothetical protein
MANNRNNDDFNSNKSDLSIDKTMVSMVSCVICNENCPKDCKYDYFLL